MPPEIWPCGDEKTFTIRVESGYTAPPAGFVDPVAGDRTRREIRRRGIDRKRNVPGRIGDRFGVRIRETPVSGQGAVESVSPEILPEAILDPVAGVG